MTPIMYVLLVLTILSVVLHCRLQAMAASLTELQIRAEVFRNHKVCTGGTCTLPPYTPRHDVPTVLAEVHILCRSIQLTQALSTVDTDHTYNVQRTTLTTLHYSIVARWKRPARSIVLHHHRGRQHADRAY